MGDALVVMTVPEEAWIGCERDLVPNSLQATRRRRGTVSWPIATLCCSVPAGARFSG